MARNRGSVRSESPQSASTPLLVDEGEESDNDSSSSQEDRHSSRSLLLTLLLSPLKDEHGTPQSIAVGLFGLVLSGTLLGLGARKSADLKGTWYPTISSCIGYTYFLMWSVSFYPQVITNFRRRTTHGLSADFAGLNVLGFACYAVYNIAMYSSESIHKQYKERHSSGEVTVQSNDVAFAVHAFCLASFTLLQIGYYDGFRSQQPSKVIGSVIAVILLVVIAYPIGLVAGIPSFNSLNYLYLLSYVKITVTLIKYIPQVLLNFRRKSTVGWSIWQILLDFSGGLLSDTQLVLDCWNMGDWTGITGNVAKFFLGFVSIFFDVIFMLQHYVLYPHHRTAIAAAVEPEEEGDKRDEGDEATNELLTV